MRDHRTVALFTELAGGPKDRETLRGRLGLHERSAHDFLDALVALGFLERQDGVYANAPATDVFLDRNKPSYIVYESIIDDDRSQNVFGL